MQSYFNMQKYVLKYVVSTPFWLGCTKPGTLALHRKKKLVALKRYVQPPVALTPKNKHHY